MSDPDPQPATPSAPAQSAPADPAATGTTPAAPADPAGQPAAVPAADDPGVTTAPAKRGVSPLVWVVAAAVLIAAAVLAWAFLSPVQDTGTYLARAGPRGTGAPRPLTAGPPGVGRPGRSPVRAGGDNLGGMPEAAPLARPAAVADPPVRRAALLFSGGPAPAANAVIGACADAFLRGGLDCVGVRHGYSGLMAYDGGELKEGEHFVRFDHRELERVRTSGGIVIGTARANPGKLVKSPADLDDPAKTAPAEDRLRRPAVDRRRRAGLPRRRRHAQDRQQVRPLQG